MALLHSISDLLAWLGWYILPFIVIMSAIVFFHELGHYLVGAVVRRARSTPFRIGFGPELFARVDSARHALADRGVAARRLRQVPRRRQRRERRRRRVGPRRSIARGRSPPSRCANRAAIVLAGPVANFILAFVIFTGFFMAFGRVEHIARIGRVEPNSPAAAAGFTAGDLVKSVDGDPIASFEGLQEATLMSTGLPMTFVVDRDGERRRADRDAAGQRGRSGRARQAPDGPSRPGVVGAIRTTSRVERCALPVCAGWGA